MYDEDQSSEGGPKSSFEVYKAEADVLLKHGEYKKAIDGYNQALELKPSDAKCLVSRSKCHLQLGDTEAALADAEASLESENNITGLLQKAESLYSKGDFERALVFYHQGNKLRPELKEFQRGIQKTQEAIDNSIGASAGIMRLEIPDDLTYFYQAEEKKKGGKTGYGRPTQVEKKKEKKQRSNVHKDSKTLKQLLGEMYKDHDFLNRLYDEEEKKTNDTSKSISEMAMEGLIYLDTRTEFWQQQKPMYARKRDKQMTSKSADGSKDPTKYILISLEEIDQAQAEGRYKDSLKQANKVLKTVEKWSDEDISNRNEIIANLHSSIGNAQLEMKNYPKALDHHNKDLDIGKEHDIPDAVSRGLDNLGRVYARMGKFEKAIEVWDEKLPMTKSALESAWLFHEIGRCHLEMDRAQEAKDYGEKSAAAADEADVDVWRLNACALIAQAEAKLGNNESALEYFEKSLDMAKVQGDEAAEKVIKKAIQEINDRIVKGLKEGEGEDEKDGGDEERKGDDAKSDVKDDDKDDEKQEDQEEEDNAKGGVKGD